eukprot:695785-Rhodomonas_salina.4
MSRPVWDGLPGTVWDGADWDGAVWDGQIGTTGRATAPASTTCARNNLTTLCAFRSRFLISPHIPSPTAPRSHNIRLVMWLTSGIERLLCDESFARGCGVWGLGSKGLGSRVNCVARVSPARGLIQGVTWHTARATHEGQGSRVEGLGAQVCYLGSGSSIQRPASSVQRLGSRLQAPGCRLQSLASPGN